MSIIQKRLDAWQIDVRIKEKLYIEKAAQNSIEWGMNHILFAPSKRIRPLLVYEANALFNEPDNDTAVLASAVELVHTYSLIHDDLPCMDNDELRRGVRTLHTYRGEAFAVLAGDAVLTRVFDLLGQYGKPLKLPGILKLFGLKSGFSGMIKGQLLDMDSETKRPDEQDINLINLHKTANLLQLSLMTGALNGNADSESVAALDLYGEYIGHIFQIKDDILDLTSTTEELGKPAGSDAKNNKASIPLLYGISHAEELLNEYAHKALAVLSRFHNRDFFVKLVDYFMHRKK